MNGAVFQVSAMMTAIWAWMPSVDHSTCLPSTSLATPLALKIHFHSSGRDDGRDRPRDQDAGPDRLRPLNARFMISAIATPMTTSMITQTTVKNVVT